MTQKYSHWRRCTRTYGLAWRLFHSQFTQHILKRYFWAYVVRCFTIVLNIEKQIPSNNQVKLLVFCSSCSFHTNVVNLFKTSSSNLYMLCCYSYSYQQVLQSLPLKQIYIEKRTSSYPHSKAHTNTFVKIEKHKRRITNSTSQKRGKKIVQFDFDWLHFYYRNTEWISRKNCFFFSLEKNDFFCYVPIVQSVCM